MGKDKKSKIKIKTARYYTKTCSKCKTEYPNWFTSCPQCGLAWDENEFVDKTTQITRKNVKIVVKVTEEDFSFTLSDVNLVFSADEGNSWYKMKMVKEIDYYASDIEDIPVGSEIIYFLEIILENGEKVIENNDGSYFFYRVGYPESEEFQKELKSEEGGNHLHKVDEERFKTGSKEENTLPTQEMNYKVCPNCKSNVKKNWSMCPSCGKTFF